MTLIGLIWTGMLVLSMLFGCLNGCAAEVGNAAVEGTEAAISFCLSVGGMICLWCSVTELMHRSGISDRISIMLYPILKAIFPISSRDKKTMDALSANFSANLLGLGNAATPMGIRAAKLMAQRAGDTAASNELCRLVVLNTASVQLLPTTVAAIRASCGASVPFDILPAVWISSLISVTVGLAVARLCEKLC